MRWIFYILQAIGHEMSVSFLDEVRNTAREFFQLPMEAKQKYKRLPEGKLEGYESDPIASEDQILDWCDRLYLLVQPENERNLALWPENPPLFRYILLFYLLNVVHYIVIWQWTVFSTLVDRNQLQRKSTTLIMKLVIVAWPEEECQLANGTRLTENYLKIYCRTLWPKSVYCNLKYSNKQVQPQDKNKDKKKTDYE